MATPSSEARLVRLFPNLANESFEIVCPASNEYNCIAYAGGDTSRRWDLPTDYYWPPSVARSPSIETLAAVFGALGYEVCSGSSLEPGYQKVALYMEDGEWTHVALQMPNGRWRSKIGDLELIEHQTPASLTGELYGRLYLHMRRRR